MTTDQAISENEALSHLERCSNKFDRLLEIQHRGLDAYATFATTILQDAKNGEFAPKKVVRAWCDLSEAWIKNGFAVVALFMPSSAPAVPTPPSVGGDVGAEKIPVVPTSPSAAVEVSAEQTSAPSAAAATATPAGEQAR